LDTDVALMYGRAPQAEFFSPVTDCLAQQRIKPRFVVVEELRDFFLSLSVCLSLSLSFTRFSSTSTHPFPSSILPAHVEVQQLCSEWDQEQEVSTFMSKA
jgi:hypothetical protein